MHQKNTMHTLQIGKMKIVVIFGATQLPGLSPDTTSVYQQKKNYYFILLYYRIFQITVTHLVLVESCFYCRLDNNHHRSILRTWSYSELSPRNKTSLGRVYRVPLWRSRLGQPRRLLRSWNCQKWAIVPVSQLCWRRHTGGKRSSSFSRLVTVFFFLI
jgi:hypothetical protein